MKNKKVKVWLEEIREDKRAYSDTRVEMLVKSDEDLSGLTEDEVIKLIKDNNINYVREDEREMFYQSYCLINYFDNRGWVVTYVIPYLD